MSTYVHSSTQTDLSRIRTCPTIVRVPANALVDEKPVYYAILAPSSAEHEPWTGPGRWHPRHAGTQTPRPARLAWQAPGRPGAPQGKQGWAGGAIPGQDLQAPLLLAAPESTSTPAAVPQAPPVTAAAAVAALCTCGARIWQWGQGAHTLPLNPPLHLCTSASATGLAFSSSLHVPRKLF